MRYRIDLAIGLTVMLATAVHAQQPQPDRQGIEFFEKKTRPLFAEHCYKCHGPDKHEAGLRLDRPGLILAGSDGGAVIVPGKPDESLLVQAVRYTDELLQMPPTGKLPEEAVADLVAWVAMGAPVPGDREPLAGARGSEGAGPSSDFDLAERRDFWCYQPVVAPALPEVRDKSWPTSPIDHFVLAKLESAGLSPASPADKRTLIRRVTFDLTGLPPTPEEVEAFLEDESPGAWERLVDRLLDSPHYGERWARHWLDLVRYAETLGHEFDFEIPNAWRYRDYVIRALNADVPYDRFVVEHLAGDLLPEPRRHPTEGFNESVLGTGFFWFGETKHSPVDARQEQVDTIDNRIDVFGKAFLGQTLACARCHDHKFDAIPTRDYYSLAGYFKSTRYQQAFLDPPGRIRAKADRLAEIKNRVRSSVAKSVVPKWLEQARRFDRYLLAARAVAGQAAGGPARLDKPTVAPGRVEQVADEFGVDASQLQRWATALEDEAIRSPEHSMFAWVKLAGIGEKQNGGSFQDRQRSLRDEGNARRESAEEAPGDEVVFEDFDGSGYDGWYVTGDAFGKGPTERGEFLVGATAAEPVRRFVGRGIAHSGLLSNRLEGVLRSKTFTLTHDYIHFLAAGRESRINLVVDGMTLIRNPIYGGLTLRLDDDALRWRTMDVGMWKGRRAYLELIDSTTPNLASPPPPKTPAGEVSDGYLVVDEIRFSNDSAKGGQAAHATRGRPTVLDSAEGAAVDSVGELAEAYRDQFVRALAGCLSREETHESGEDDSRRLVNWLLENHLLQMPTSGEKAEAPLEGLLASYDTSEGAIPAPLRAPAAADGTGEDEYVFVRGSYKNHGERAPRRLPVAVAGADQPECKEGSGRLAMARRLVDPANPLVARVMVNRLWMHHFGKGLVATPDDFGRMGGRPTHPELLDYLADSFVRSGWSIKQMHRLILMSSTYRMSSGPRPQADEADPDNELLHRMPVRRLEAEAIRDAILAVSGRLDGTLYGPGVVPYLTPFMEGRGRPKESGPLDGDGRRSLYINVRRNFLTPMLLAFDYPLPFTTIGRRNVSNVPAQALILMNSPFVVDEARRWAEGLLAEPDRTEEERIDRIFETAFARPPTPEEIDEALAFLRSTGVGSAVPPEEQTETRTAGAAADLDAWADLCHVILNAKEFIFIR